MPARPGPAPQPPSRSATALAQWQYVPMPPKQRGPCPAEPRHPAAPPPYPNIPRQWTGPAGETFAPRWNDPDQPPAGLSAPLLVPKTHPIRNTLLGITGVLVAIVVLGGIATSTVVAPLAGSATTIEAWRDGGGIDLVKALSKDLVAVEDAGRAEDISGVNRACLALQSDTEAAQAYVPIPDAEAQAHWAAALAHMAQASTTCVTAVQNQDGALLAQTSNEMDAVPADVIEVINRLTALDH